METMREQLVKHLEGGEAFKSVDDFLTEIPFNTLGIRPVGLPYSFYELFYHIAYAQRDIWEFIVSKDYSTPNWPKDYWPENKAPKNEAEWKELISNYFEIRQKLCKLILDDSSDLQKPVKNGENQTLFREVLLVLEHTAYHTGQLVVLQRLLKLI